MTARRFGVHLDIEGAMRNLKPMVEHRPTGPSNLFVDKDGNAISAATAYALLAVDKARGRKCLPMSEGCGVPCPSGCAGFDFTTGCPGVQITKE